MWRNSVFLTSGELLFAVVIKVGINSDTVPFTQLVINIVLRKYETKPLQICSNIKKVQCQQIKVIIHVDKVIRHCVFMEIGNETFITLGETI